MKITYKAEFELRLASAIKEIADFENSINKSMEEMGRQEKLSVTTKAFTIDVSVDRELTDEEQYKMKVLLKAQVIESMPKYDIRLKSFSRKSEQSALQSVE